MINECGAVDEMTIVRWTRSTGRKPAPKTPHSPQIPHALAWDQTRVAAVGSRRLTAWAVAWLTLILSRVWVTYNNGVRIGNCIVCSPLYNHSKSQITALSLIYPLHKLLGHANSSQSSVVVAWQRIYNSFTVTTAYIMSSLHRQVFSWLNWTTTELSIRVVCYDRRSVGQSVLE
jgi:hypothetical protein